MTVNVLLYDEGSAHEPYSQIKIHNVDSNEDDFDYQKFATIIQKHLDVCKQYVVDQGNEEWQVDDIIHAFNFHMESTDCPWRISGDSDAFIECYL